MSNWMTAVLKLTHINCACQSCNSVQVYWSFEVKSDVKQHLIDTCVNVVTVDTWQKFRGCVSSRTVVIRFDICIFGVRLWATNKIWISNRMTAILKLTQPRQFYQVSNLSTVAIFTQPSTGFLLFYDTSSLWNRENSRVGMAHINLTMKWQQPIRLALKLGCVNMVTVDTWREFRGCVSSRSVVIQFDICIFEIGLWETFYKKTIWMSNRMKAVLELTQRQVSNVNSVAIGFQHQTDFLCFTIRVFFWNRDDSRRLVVGGRELAHSWRGIALCQYGNSAWVWHLTKVSRLCQFENSRSFIRFGIHIFKDRS